jgi:hypothetical protein
LAWGFEDAEGSGGWRRGGVPRGEEREGASEKDGWGRVVEGVNPDSRVVCEVEETEVGVLPSENDKIVIGCAKVRG